MLQQLTQTDNKVLPLENAQASLIAALAEERLVLQHAAIVTLAGMDSTSAQRAVAKMALDENVAMETRLLAFANLTGSAKRFGNLLLAEQIDAMYNDIVSTRDADSQLRSLASQAYGSLNLPSAKISQLILDQSKKDFED